MKKLSNLFLVTISVLVLAWFLPWLVGFAIPSATKMPTVHFSPTANKFVTMDSDDDGKPQYLELNADGTIAKKLTRDERDQLLPQIFYTVLSGKDELPDSVCGREVSIKIFKENSWVFVSNPREVNKVPARVYMMMESMPERLELEDATEVFRFTNGGMEFIDMATDAVLPERSARFTKMLKDEGFVFPATVVNANVTSRKQYDEGYLMVDANHKLFHVKMQVGRPYVRRVDEAKKLNIQHVFVTENIDHRFLGIVTDSDDNAYMLEASTYSMHRLPFKWNPEKEKIILMANCFNWVANISDAEESTYYAVDNGSLSLLGRFHKNIRPSLFEKMEDWIFPFSLSFTSTDSQIAHPHIDITGSWMVMILNAALAVVLLLIRRRKGWCMPLCCTTTLVLGIYIFVSILLFTKSK